MKKRVLVFGVLMAVFLVLAFSLGAARRSVTAGYDRDFAAERFRGANADKYTQLSLYCTEEDYLTPDGMMAVKNSIESGLTAESLPTAGNYLLCASIEKNVTITREQNTSSAVATVYFGDYFGLHPALPLTGGFLEESDATTEFCVIDDFAAWRLFGSVDVCGMDLEINGKYYTISAVLAADRGTYSKYYGITPRVYILYNSAAMRDQNLSFTSLEAVLPDPITDFGHDLFASAVSSYGEAVVINHERFTPLRLWEKIKGMTSLGVMTGASYPYYENMSRIMETKCAMLLTFEAASFILAAAMLVCLAVSIFRPLLRRFHEKRRVRKIHAF